jgi:DNA-binding NtrC family response regulator
MHTPRILFVDDEVEFISLLAERLSSRNIIVDTAFNGIEAINLVNEHIYDAIFLDMAMPGLNGLETLKIMLEKKPDLLVYFLTGQSTLKQGVEAVKLGAKDVIEKPADLTDIIDIIKKSEEENALKLEKKLKEHLADIILTKGW